MECLYSAVYESLLALSRRHGQRRKILELLWPDSASRYSGFRSAYSKKIFKSSFAGSVIFRFPETCISELVFATLVNLRSKMRPSSPSDDCASLVILK